MEYIIGFIVVAVLILLFLGLVARCIVWAGYHIMNLVEVIAAVVDRIRYR